MPFKSQAQRRWMYATHPEMAKEWESHTPKNKKLPEKVSMDLTMIRAFRDELEKIAGLPSALRSAGFRAGKTGIQAMHPTQYGAARQMRALHGAQAAQSMAQKAPGQVTQKYISQGQRAKAIGQQGLPQAAPAVPQIAPVTPRAAPAQAPAMGPPAGTPERRAVPRVMLAA